MNSNLKATPEFLYKILSSADWAQSQTLDDVKLGAIDTHFIHLATKEQLGAILKKFWPGDATAVILKLDVRKLKGNLVLENNPGGTTKYFHLYQGAIPLGAVLGVFDQTNPL